MHGHCSGHKTCSLADVPAAQGLAELALRDKAESIAGTKALSVPVLCHPTAVLHNWGHCFDPKAAFFSAVLQLHLVLVCEPLLAPSAVREVGTFCHCSTACLGYPGSRASFVVEGAWIPRGFAILFHLPPLYIHM